jgi:hypothetical protein
LRVVELSESAIREAADTVFAQSHFHRKRGWFDGFEIPLPDWPPRVWWTLLAITLGTMVLAFVAQQLPGARRARALAGGGGAPGVQRDAWLHAQELADRGDYLSALHALFGAVVTALGRAREVDPHPAKTVGDYTRELWERRSGRADSFADFAMRYERAVYAALEPDRAAFDSIARLAQPLATGSRVIR